MECGKGVEQKVGKNEVLVSIEAQPPDSSTSHFLKGIKSNKDLPRTASATRKNYGIGLRMASITRKTPKMASQVREGEMQEEEQEEEEEDDNNNDVFQSYGKTKESAKNCKAIFLFEWILFLCIIGVFIASLTVPKLQHHKLWGQITWKWCLLLLVTFCGRLLIKSCFDVILCMIEMIDPSRKEPQYYGLSLKNSVQVLIWFALILLAWELLIIRGVKQPKSTTKVLNIVTRALISCLIGTTMWVVKTFAITKLTTTISRKKFFDRVQDSLFHQYVLLALSLPPPPVRRLARLAHKVLLVNKWKKGGEVVKQKVDTLHDIDKLYKMLKENKSAQNMWVRTKVIQDSQISIMSNAVNDEGVEKKVKEITSEWEAQSAAALVFRKVARPGCKYECLVDINYIYRHDLVRFMKMEEADKVLSLFEGAKETRKIMEPSFRNWVVNVYKDRKLLAHALEGTKTSIEELNKVLSGILLVFIIILSLLIMGLASTQLLVLLSSQIAVMAFIFGNTCKTVFESLIFVFVSHPFHVGDCCVIDGEQLIVEEVKILTTTFLSHDKEIIIYPNSVLASKPIKNFHRIPVTSESVEFIINASASTETIEDLKAKIKEKIKKRPEHWCPKHSLEIKEIEDLNKMIKMALSLKHSIYFLDDEEKSTQRSELLFELKNIFEELNIKFHLLPR